MLLEQNGCVVFLIFLLLFHSLGLDEWNRKSFSCLAKGLFRHLERKRDFRAVFGVFQDGLGFLLFVWFVLLFLLLGVVWLGVFLLSLFPWSLEKVWNVFLSRLLRVRA